MIGKRKRLGSEEFELVAEALLSQDLWPYDYGGKERHYIGEATDAIRSYFRSPVDQKVPYMVPTASGTSSIQVALGGLQIPAGSEVIVPPITDIGTVNPVLFHNAIPVFADVDPESCLLTPETVRKALNKKRTSAVIAVHLTGSPVDIPGIIEVLREEKMEHVKIIEDVAQGLGAKLDNIPLGMLGDAGCFSLNSQKHITVGEGGFVLVKNENDYLRCHSFSDKHRNRLGAHADSEHSKYKGLGHSLRMSELQGAMLLAQLPKLEGFARARYRFGSEMNKLLKAQTNLIPQPHMASSRPSYFYYMFAASKEIDPIVKDMIIDEINDEVAASLKLRFAGSYSHDDLPMYRYDVFANKNFSPKLEFWPAELIAEKVYGSEKEYDYNKTKCPSAEDYLKRSFSVYFDERHEATHAQVLTSSIAKTFHKYGVQ